MQLPGERPETPPSRPHPPNLLAQINVRGWKRGRGD